MPTMLPQMMSGTAGSAGGGGGFMSSLANLLGSFGGSGGGGAGGGGMGFQPGGMGFLDLLKMLGGGGGTAVGGAGGGGTVGGGAPGALDPRQLFQLMLLQQLSQSPFYQGEPVQGAGSQIMQALLPFLTANMQSKFLGQQQQYAMGEQQLERGRKELQDIEKDRQFYEGEIGKTRRAKIKAKATGVNVEAARVNAIELEKLRQKGRIAAKEVPQAREPSVRDALVKAYADSLPPKEKDAFVRQMVLHEDFWRSIFNMTAGGTLGEPEAPVGPPDPAKEALRKKLGLP